MPFITFCVRPGDRSGFVELVRLANDPGNCFQWKFESNPKSYAYDLLTLASSEEHIRIVRGQLEASESLVDAPLPGFKDGVSEIKWPVDPAL